MRILYYNWVAPDDDEKRGGGVSVYQRNLIEHLARQGTKVDFLSAGLSHTIDDDSPKIRQTKNSVSPNCRTFEMLNSPLMSPGHSAFGQNSQLFEEGKAYECFIDFIAKNGTYDVVHFNNLEGIPFSFLKLKDHFPETVTVLSHHNYFAICPQVNLWHKEQEHCADSDKGSKCVNCIQPSSKPETLGANQLATLLKANGIGFKDPVFSGAFSDGSTLALLGRINQSNRRQCLDGEYLSTKADQIESFRNRRRSAIDLMNSHVDLNLAVSSRVARIIRDAGVDSRSIRVCYIGTKMAEGFAKVPKRKTPLTPGMLSICYLGYMRADKGFYFFLDALERMPNEIAQKLCVKIAARSYGNKESIDRIATLRSRFARVDHLEGYSHDQLEGILQDVDLGVVPVLWEDNLPQVALEIMSQGIPLLTSNRGGAQELGANGDFVFEAGSSSSLIRALSRLATRRIELGEFWIKAMKLPSMDEHLSELMGLYCEGVRCYVKSQSKNSSRSNSSLAGILNRGAEDFESLAAQTFTVMGLMND